MAGAHLARWLDELAEAAAEVEADDPGDRARLAAVVHDLEHRAGAGLGDSAGDPVVVLWRRLDRARRLLLAGAGEAHVPAAADVPAVADVATLVG